VITAAVLVLVAAASAAPRAAGQEPKPAEPPAIVTHGEGVVQRTPDLAFVTLVVETRAANPRDAQQQNAAAAAAVLKRFADAGVARDAVRTIGLRLDQEFDSVGGRRVSRGYVARNTIEARIDDVGRAGELSDAAVQSGATSLEGIRFDLKDRPGAEREALRLAVADARARADAAASGAGRTVDRILRIEEQGGARVIGPRGPMVAQLTAERAVTPVEPGLLEVRAAVTLTAAMR